MINWYDRHFPNNKHQLVRKVLCQESLHSPNLAKNVLYQMFCGMPSGFGLTVECNDFVNQLYMRYCWKVITKEPLSNFYKNCYICTYGDDIIMSVSNQKKEIFNFESIQNLLEEYNIAFTPASKDETSYKTLPLNEVTFLKAHFVLHPFRRGVYLAKLPEASSLDMLNWIYKGNDKFTASYEASRASLQALYGHGEEVFSFWRNKIDKWFSDQDYPFPHLKTWREIDFECFDDVF